MMRHPCCLLAAGGFLAATAIAADVYIVPFSHLDLFWGGSREECLARGNRIIAKAIDIARRQPEFRFLIEDMDFTANYVESHAGAPELEELKRLVKDGRIEIAPKWAAIYQNLPDGEVQVRNIVYGKRYARSVFGVDPQVAHLGDLPGYTPQFPQILAGAGIPYMVMTRMGPSDKSLFRWRAPDGSRALVWSALKGYGWGTRFGLHTAVDDAKRNALEKDLADVRATTQGPIYMTWGSDLWAPGDKIAENVAALNRKEAGRFVLATPSVFFREAAKTAGIPELSGEIPSSWPNVPAALAHIWPRIVPATNTLLNAETFAAVNWALGFADYPQQRLDALWRKLIEAMDHNQDGQGAGPGDERKSGYLEMAILDGGEILRNMLRNIAERVRLEVPHSHAIVVFNPSGWPRTDLVKAHMTLYGDVWPADIGAYRKGMQLVDGTGRALPCEVREYSENISRALDIRFVAADVPPVGYRTFYLVPAERPAQFANTSAIHLDSANDARDPRRPLGSDTIENQHYRVQVDKATGRVSVFDKDLGRTIAKDLEIVAREERGGNYIGVEPLSGRVIPNLVTSVAMESNGPVQTVVRIAGRIADIPIVQRLHLYAGMKRIDIENTVVWRRPRLLRIEQLFPIEPADAKISYGVPFGANDASNIIPATGPHQRDEITKEAWTQSRDIQNWLFAGSQGWGLTLAADHHQIKVTPGVLRAAMLRGTRFTSVRVVRNDVPGSLSYPLPGSYVFRYALTSGAGDWRAAKAYRTGAGVNKPLLAISVSDDITAKSLPPVNTFCSLTAENLVLSALKKADGEPGILVRLYEIEGAPASTEINFLGAARAIRQTNLLEEDTNTPAQRVLSVLPHQIRTVKLAPPVQRR